MLHQIYILIREYETSTQKKEYEYLYKKDDELKDKNEGTVEYGNDFINFKIIQDRDST